jgi:hypothetical protein
MPLRPALFPLSSPASLFPFGTPSFRSKQRTPPRPCNPSITGGLCTRTASPRVGCNPSHFFCMCVSSVLCCASGPVHSTHSPALPCPALPCPALPCLCTGHRPPVEKASDPCAHPFPRFRSPRAAALGCALRCRLLASVCTPACPSHCAHKLFPFGAAPTQLTNCCAQVRAAISCLTLHPSVHIPLKYCAALAAPSRAALFGSNPPW